MMKESTHNFNQLINFVNPLGFIDYCNLQLNAHVVLSDSGSISEESALLGFKAITLRDSLERPEALESGSILMSGLDSRRVVSAIEFVQESKLNPVIPADYLISNTSARVMNFMLSTYHVRDFWLGLR
jgi:UDP-N-acetylglucosamine 2-epimerase (non-hydrolysing)